MYLPVQQLKNKATHSHSASAHNATSLHPSLAHKLNGVQVGSPHLDRQNDLCVRSQSELAQIRAHAHWRWVQVDVLPLPTRLPANHIRTLADAIEAFNVHALARAWNLAAMHHVSVWSNVAVAIFCAAAVVVVISVVAGSLWERPVPSLGFVGAATVLPLTC